jgi:hypothetical protein
MASPYTYVRLCTEAQLRAQNSLFNITNSPALDPLTITTLTEQADRLIYSRVAGTINFWTAAGYAVHNYIPDYLNQLSLYKTAEYCLLYLYGQNRKQDSPDIAIYVKKFEDLLEEVRAGCVDLEVYDSGIVGLQSSDFARGNVPPALGMGRYGNFINDEQLANERLNTPQSSEDAILGIGY